MQFKYEVGAPCPPPPPALAPPTLAGRGDEEQRGAPTRGIVGSRVCPFLFEQIFPLNPKTHGHAPLLCSPARASCALKTDWLT